MTDAVDQAMQALQAALFGREVYSPDHPAVIRQQARAAQMLQEVLDRCPRVSLIAFDDRVVYENAPLASSNKLIGGIFARLLDRGVECLTFERGVTDQEIATLLDQLPQRVVDGGVMQPSAHVHIGFVQGTTQGTGNGVMGGDQTMLSPDLRQRAGVLQNVWQDMYNQGDCSAQALGGVVADICYTVGISSGVMLPLATLKNHDEYTYIHTINVAILSAGLSEAIGLRPDQVYDVTLAALMHDVGKRKVPKRLLQKQGPLTDAELAIMQRHPLDGARLLFGSANVPELARVVAYEHHMHLNGTGYPRVTPGWKTSLPSQIVQVADVFDALRTHRPYREALSLEKSTQIMTDDADVKFDKTLLDVFFERVARQTDRELEADCTVTQD